MTTACAASRAVAGMSGYTGEPASPSCSSTSASSDSESLDSGVTSGWGGTGDAILQGALSERAWRFESSQPHHATPPSALALEIAPLESRLRAAIV